MILKNSYGISFYTDRGSMEGTVNFNNISARYSQILRSGTPGSDIIKLSFSNNFISETTIEYIWIQPPASFHINLYNDSKIFVNHYIAVLSWSPPTISYDEIKLKGYAIYRSFNGNSWEIIATPSPSTLKLSDPIGKIPVMYRILSLDKDDNESSKLEVKWE